MPTDDAVRETDLLRRIRSDEPLVAAELRPPRANLTSSEGMETWIDLHHALRRLTRQDTVVFLTDDAVGDEEEENLRHLTTNLAGDLPTSRVCPFLTSKHPLEYCLRYADRAYSSGLEALTVLGGDRSVGPPRCVEHAYILRRKIRRRIPDLPLGGWANPHRDPEEQVGYLLDEDFTAEYFLTQAVSHHHLETVEAFLEELRRRDVPHPAVFGVFFYRSPNPDTLRSLSRFFPVPAEEVTREFERGDSPEEICARTIRALRGLGVKRVYVSNLGYGEAAARMRRIRSEL